MSLERDLLDTRIPQVARERRQYAQRGLTYASECLAIRRRAGLQGSAEADAGAGRSASARVAFANALHLLGYHCAEFASGLQAKGYFEQATAALSRAHAIFRELGDDEMTATVLQDLGLCYYYQRRYKEAMALYTSACHVIIKKLGSCHPDLAVPSFNIANIMCAADEYGRAIDFYRIAYSINVRALGEAHAWTKTALLSLQEAVEYQKQITAAGHVVVELQIDPGPDGRELGTRGDEQLDGEGGDTSAGTAGGLLEIVADLCQETRSSQGEEGEESGAQSGGGGSGGGAVSRDRRDDEAASEPVTAETPADDGAADAGSSSGLAVGGDGGRVVGWAVAEQDYAVLSGAAIERLLQKCLKHVDIDVDDEMEMGGFDSESEEDNASETGGTTVTDNQLFLIEKQLQVGRERVHVEKERERER